MELPYNSLEMLKPPSNKLNFPLKYRSIWANEATIAAFLTDILDANDPALLAAALVDIAHARGHE
jgi:DNA-binding phage protein